MIEDYFLKINLSWFIYIWVATVKTVIFPNVYKDFKDIFIGENTSYLLLYKNYDYIIDIIDTNPPFYRLIYNLSENKFSIF